MKYANNEGHDHRRRRRQRARPGQRQRQGRDPRPADDARHGAADFERPVRPLRGPGRDPGRRRRGVDRQRRERVLGAAAAAPPAERHQLRLQADHRTRTSRPASGGQDQLAYYSNYGPRIDVAAPGGARKFNLPVVGPRRHARLPLHRRPTARRRGRTFSITSNWALEIPCFTFTGGGFPADQCYSTIQGTSMATPHASAVLALIASAKPNLAHNPAGLVKQLTDDGPQGQGQHHAGAVGHRPVRRRLERRGPAPRATATSVDPPSPTRRRTAPAS